MKLELDRESCGRVRQGDIVTVREIKSYCGRHEDNLRYGTIEFTSEQTFGTSFGANDYHRGEKTVKRVINDGMAVLV